MLITVFGVWLMASNITFLNAHVEKDKCWINFVDEAVNVMMTKHDCDEVAAEINKQLEK